ncbi:MAG: hypothetical protein JRJ85_28895 [Deltaproteobacteria bacterium]|nr:hypothetical protein [Deltaproteobacteria bacterium]
MIHKNPTIVFNTLFGKLKISSPYLWCPGKNSSKPLIDDMKICHHGRSEAVNRALSDFGIEESFATAAARFKEHYHYEIGQSAANRSTKNTALQVADYIEELDGCEIRTASYFPVCDPTETTPVYHNRKKAKVIKWRDVRLGFVRPLDSKSKTFVGKMDSYQDVVSQMHSAAVLKGMTPETKVVGVADGGIGLSEELKRQFRSPWLG